MKNIYHIGVTCMILILTACSSDSSNNPKIENNSSKEEELRGFMVGGMYFIEGYGGLESIEGNISQNGTEKNDVINSYYDLFLLPYKTDSKDVSIATLKNWWDISSKEDLLITLKELKDPSDSADIHEAWNYARFVNNVCLGYSSGYLTQDEAKHFVKENFALVKKKFKSWDEFFIDFIAGRREWEGSTNDNFEAIVFQIKENNKNNIYKILPLQN